jgi:hypothetical protein
LSLVDVGVYMPEWVSIGLSSFHAIGAATGRISSALRPFFTRSKKQ